MKKLIQLLAVLFLATVNIQFAEAQPLSGQYTIDPTGDYASFTDAFLDLQMNGLEGDAEFIVTEDTYSETLDVSLTASEYSVTFKPNPSNTEDVIIQSAADYVVNIISAQNMSFEGIHFKNIATDPQPPANVIFFEPGTTQTKNISFTGCTFTGYNFPPLSDATDKELILSALPTIDQFMPDSLLFDNCQFVNGEGAVKFKGEEGFTGSYVKIMNSEFTNFFSVAFISEYYDSVSLSGNTFDWKQGDASVFPVKIYYGNTIEIIDSEMIGDFNSENDFTGIKIDYSEQITVSKNKIDVNFTGENGNAVGIRFGFDTLVDVSNNYIRLNSNDSNTGIRFLDVTDNISVSNNMIIAYSESENSMEADGINISLGESAANIDLTYNSISIPKGSGSALVYSNMMMMGTINIYNNIFTNNSDSPVMTLDADTDNFNSNYNIFATGSNVLIENPFNDQFSDKLSNWQTFNGDDMNSFQVNPQFIDPMSNLHLKPLNPAEGRAMSITEVSNDFDGQVRNTESPDIGADEGNFVLLDFIVDAGPNQTACSDVYNLQATDPTPATGEWSVVKGDAVIQNIADPSTQITNVAPGENIFRWSVTDGSHTAFDQLVIFNQQPIADAGEDVGLYLDDLAGVYPSVTLEAVFDNESDENFGGLWEIVSPIGTLELSNPVASSLTVTGLEQGIHTLSWTVTYYGDPECSNSDELNIVAGHSFVSDPPDENEYNWDDPTFWDLGQVPGANDSVTVFGSNLSVKGTAAQCNQLVIGSGTEFNIEGDGKANGSLSTQGLFIEQSAVKFKNAKGDANVRVGSGGGLFIEQSAVKSSKASGSNSGIRVGSGGGLFIEQTAVKADGDAEVRISSGGLFIEQTAVKAEGDAVVRVGNGGGLFIEQTAVKSSKSTGDNPGIRIGNGGGLFIEQTAVKSGKGAQVSLGAGRGIFIEQSAVKAGQQNGLVVRGGGLFIEQSAVKSTGSGGKITVGNGGGLFIEQSAVKSDAQVSAPYVEILGGQVVVGAESKSKAQGGKLSFRGLFIEQTAVKGLASDTALIVNPGASVYLDERYSEGSPKFEVQAGNAVNAKAGSSLFEEGSSENVKLILDEGASLVDHSESPALWGLFRHNFKAGKYDMMTVPMESIEATQFDLNPNLTVWSEDSIAWLDASANTFSAGQGMMVKYPDTDLEQGFMGFFNKGSLSVPLTNSSEDLHAGWNLTGNPYPSALNWDILSLDPNINPAVYVYDADQKAFKIYQQNGIQLNGASKYIMPGEAFLIKTASNAVNINFSPEAQVHYMAKPAATENTVNQLLKLDVSGNGFSDETAVYFVEGATEVWDAQYDVQKIMNIESESLNLYSKSTSTDYFGAFAINGLEPGIGSYTIPLGFEANVSGDYEISLNTNTLENIAVSIQLEDLETGELHDLKDNPTYSFEHTAGVKQDRFNLKIGEGVNGYEVTFTVTDGTDPLSDATVSIESGSETVVTDASGTATAELQDGTYSFEVTRDGYENYTDAFTVSGSSVNVPIEMSVSTGIEELIDGLSIYPNPSQGIVNIIGKDELKVQISDVFGKTIKEEIINKSGRIIIETPGVYFFKISNNGQTITEKVIIK
jgi:hypothetical protein